MEEKTSDGAEDTKKCPYCAETIKKEAIYCRFCRKDLEGNCDNGEQKEKAEGDGSASTETPAIQTVKAKSGVVDGVKMGCGMFIVLPILLFAGFLLLLIIFVR